MDAVSPIRKLSLDHPNDIARFSDWQIDFRQLEAGRLKTQLRLRFGEGVDLLAISMNRMVHQMGLPPKDAVTFGMPKRGAIHVWASQRLRDDTILAFNGANGFEGVNGTAFSGLVVSLAKHQMEQVADDLGLALPDHLMRQSTAYPVASRDEFQALFSAAQPLLADPQAAFTKSQSSELSAQLLAAATSADPFRDRSSPARRGRALRRALDCIADHADEPIAVGEICAKTGIAWRTLERAFREEFGLGPKAYLNRFRLGRVRSALLRAPPKAVIADCANEWGFWHMGQFAKDYKLMFGELPSQTLRQSDPGR